MTEFSPTGEKGGGPVSMESGAAAGQIPKPTAVRPTLTESSPTPAPAPASLYLSAWEKKEK